jgi:membrane associated rhomboid family serine protease
MTWSAVVTSVAVLAALALVLIALFRLISTMIAHRTIRQAVTSNPELAEGVLQKLTARRESSGDDRLAFVLIAIGLAMAIAPLIAVDDRGIVRFALGAALFPLLVGGALWLRSRAALRAKRRAGGQ